MSESKNIERFSPVKDVLRTKIITDPGRFQGRETDFSSDTVKAIVAKGYYDRSASPIKVWWDDVKDKYVVLAGHSRLAAFDRIHTRYDLSRTIPVIVFQGDEDDAMDYAIIESNRKSTEEGLMSDLNAYRRAVKSGKSRKYLLSVFKPESKLGKLQKLIHLNPKGRFIEMLSGTSALSFPYLERNAQWIGDMRSQLPQLSNSHELELFKYIYDGGKGLKLDKAQLYKVVNDRVGRIDFDPAAPLNLQNHVSSSAYVDPINEEIANVTKEIERSKKEIDDKRATIVRAKEQFGDIKKGEGYKLTSPIFKRIDDLNRFILRKIEEREKLKQQAGRVERTVTADLFSEPEAPKVEKLAQPVVAPVASIELGGVVGMKKYSEPKGYNSEIEVGQKYYDNRYGDYYTIEKMTPVEGGDVDVTLKYDKGKTRTESGNFLLYHIDAKQHSLSKEQPIVAEAPQAPEVYVPKLHEFDCMYNGKETTIRAYGQYKAQQAAAKLWKVAPKNEYRIAVSPGRPVEESGTLQDRVKKLPEKVDHQEGDYYVSVVYNDETYLMLGPFKKHQAALDNVSYARAFANTHVKGNDSKKAIWGAWGTVRYDKSEHPTYGSMNEPFVQFYPSLVHPAMPKTKSLATRVKEAKEYFVGAGMIEQMTSDKATYTMALLDNVQRPSRTSKENEAIDFWESTGFLDELNYDERYYVEALIEHAQNKPLPTKLQKVKQKGVVKKSPELSANLELKRKRAKAYAFAQAQRIRLLQL